MGRGVRKERKETKEPVTGGLSSPEMPHPRSEEYWVLRVKGRSPSHLFPPPATFGSVPSARQKSRRDGGNTGEP